MAPEVKVIAALARHTVLDHDGLMRRTRLAAVTLDLTLQKLLRMGRVAEGIDGYRLTARGVKVAKELRTGRWRTWTIL